MTSRAGSANPQPPVVRPASRGWSERGQAVTGRPSLWGRVYQTIGRRSAPASKAQMIPARTAGHTTDQPHQAKSRRSHDIPSRKIRGYYSVAPDTVLAEAVLQGPAGHTAAAELRKGSANCSIWVHPNSTN